MTPRTRHALAVALAASLFVASCSGSDPGEQLDALADERAQDLGASSADEAADEANGDTTDQPDDDASAPPVDDAEPGSVDPSGVELAAAVAPSTPLPTNQWWSPLLDAELGSTLWAFPTITRIQADGLAIGASRVLRVDPTVIETLFIPELRLATATSRAEVVDYGSHSVTFEIDVTDGQPGDDADAVDTRTVDAGTLSLDTIDEDATADAPVPLGASHPARVTVAQGWPYIHVDTDGPIELYLQGGTPSEIDSAIDGLHLQVASEHGNWDIASSTPATWEREGDRVVITPEQSLVLTMAAQPHDAELSWFQAFVDVTAYPLRSTESEIVVDWDEGVVRQDLRWIRESQNPAVVAVMPHQAVLLDIDPDEIVGEFLAAQGRLTAIGRDAISLEAPLRTPLLALPELDELPAFDGFDFAQLLASESARQAVSGGSYFHGKGLGRVATLAELASIAGDSESLASLLELLQVELLDVALASGDDDAHWAERDPVFGGVFVRPSEFGNDRYDDHHFQYAYLIRAAATLFELDPETADSEAGQTIARLIEALVADVVGDPEIDIPFRVWNAYEGHSYATGKAVTGAGANQESSSEAAHAWESVARWALVVDDADLAEQAIAQWTLETHAARTYWLGEYEYPGEYEHDVIGIYWGAKVDFATFFDGRPEAAVGIQLLPFTMASLYRSPATADLDHLGEFSAGEASLWPDLFVMEQAMHDPQAAVAELAGLADIEAGNSFSLVQYWLQLMLELGVPSDHIRAGGLMGMAFDSDGQTQLVVRNITDAPVDVTFYDADDAVVGVVSAEPGRTEIVTCEACDQ